MVSAFKWFFNGLRCKYQKQLWCLWPIFTMSFTILLACFKGITAALSDLPALAIITFLTILAASLITMSDHYPKSKQDSQFEPPSYYGRPDLTQSQKGEDL